MELLFKNHIPIANKWLIIFSGINKNAILKNGKKQYEQHAFHIPKEWLSIKWTRSLIKQTLCFLALTDSKGNIGVISLEQIAKIIHCSTRTVKENLQQLHNLGLLETQTLWGEYRTLRFLNYKENFLDLYPVAQNETKTGQTFEVLSDEDREIPHHSYTGYTTIKQEALLELFDMKNINELKLACRAIYLYEKEVNIAGNEQAYLTYTDLKGILPKYYAFKAQIKKGFQALKKLFDYQTLEKEQVIKGLLSNQKTTPSLLEKLKNPFLIGFTFHKDKDSRYIQKKDQDEAFFSFMLFANEMKIKPISYDQQASLISEFGLFAVKDGLQEILDLFHQPYSGVRSTMMDAIDTKPIQTLRKYIQKHYMEKITLY